MTYRRILALVLALAALLTCMPLTGALAESATGLTRAFIVNDDGTETEISQEELEVLRSESSAEMPGEIDVVLADTVDGGETPAPPEGEDEAPADAANGAIEEGGNAVLLDMPALTGGSSAALRNEKIPNTVTVKQKGHIVTVKGTVSKPYYFLGLFVDTTLVAAVQGSKVNRKIDMRAFDTGYHTVALAVVKGKDSTDVVGVVGETHMVSNNISDRPTYKGKFEVRNTYLNFYPYNMALQNTGGDLYIEFSSNGGKNWTRYGAMRANMIELYISQNYKISGLKPETVYRTRLRFGEYVTYPTDYAGDGKSHFFGGPAFKSTTIKTGASKAPAIDSVKAKATHVKYHKVKHYGYYTGVYLYTEKFYTYKVKVTVKLKSKPGTNGIFINDKWVAGDKKTYETTFTPYPNYSSKKPKGHIKYTITVCSGQNKNWGGYSPSWSKTKTLS